MIEGATVLVVDDNAAIRNLFERVLGPEGVTVLTAETMAAGKEHLARTPVDMLFLDLFLPDGNGMELLYAVKKNASDLPVVIITGHGTIERAVEAIKAGAFDFLRKPLEHIDLIRITAEKAMDQRKMLRENWDLKQALSSRYRMDRLVGKSAGMQRIFKIITQLAENEATVLIHGESGTGKELLAQAIHYNSPRRLMKFVPVDCGSLPETLIESELFGHVKGAYTGAYRDVKGLFREAEGGTIFLDEIGELPTHVQSKLLRTLQEREVRPVGAAKALPVNVRVIAASHRDLKSEAANGMFREDLFYRLNVVYLEIPPLRERREDVPLLLDHFLEESAKRTKKRHQFSPEAMQRLLQHDWPGNVRELQNLVEHVLAFAGHPEIKASDLPALGDNGAKTVSVPEVPLSFDAYEKLAIERALREAQGNVDEAARLLDVGLSTFYRKMKKHKIPPPRSARERVREPGAETAAE
ncbi:MAG TPA: sigma-54 dependent transcriptional regulator [bacterium]|nr:sigma-54 dependent transcriptional regulator [bacterium]